MLVIQHGERVGDGAEVDGQVFPEGSWWSLIASFAPIPVDIFSPSPMLLCYPVEDKCVLFSQLDVRDKENDAGSPHWHG